jgi:hypothetical protein
MNKEELRKILRSPKLAKRVEAVAAAKGAMGTNQLVREAIAFWTAYHEPEVRPFGQTLRDFKKRHKLTTPELGEIIHCSKTRTLEAWLIDRNTPPIGIRRSIMGIVDDHDEKHPA